MGKKSRKKEQPVITAPAIGTSLGFKMLGKPLYVAATIIDSETINEAWEQNSEEGKFVALPEKLNLIDLKNIPEGKTGQALGLVVFNDPTKIEGDTITGEFLPYKVGAGMNWRNPRIGHLLDEEEDVLEMLKESASFYPKAFPGYDNIFKIEQVVDPMGWSVTLGIRIDKQIQSVI